MRKLAILGSTGSIGTQALEVASKYPDRWEIEAILAHSNTVMFFEQVRKHHPKFAALVKKPDSIPEDIQNSCRWIFGKEALISIIRECDADDVLVSVVGFAGLDAVMEALEQKKRVLLANKEPLVAAGDIVMSTAQKKKLDILPVDSEHSAIFQCLRGAERNVPTRIILTASGGPFRKWKKEDIERATKEDALRHPNWNMGRKITIDSASMMNKALEVIEARWLFDMPPEKIDVIVHPQSIVHSMVEYDDGAIIAQMGVPDMRLPILYAMSYPQRLQTGGKPLSFSDTTSLTFELPDTERFPALKLGYEALKTGGTMPAILNGANEVAVEAFLNDRIHFGTITNLVEETTDTVPAIQHPSLEEVYAADRAARQKAQELLLKDCFCR